MTERITLELSDTTMQRAREVARQTNRPLEAILAEWLERSSIASDIYPLDLAETYHIYTPFGAEATARSLLELLNEDDNEDSSANAGDHAS
jgi:hypothetical protein